MKRLSSLVIVLLLLVSIVRSQTITITFEGTLNAAPIPLDSILVMNLTAGGDTTIYFPDNVLVLGSTGLHGVAAQAPVLRNHPNPFTGGTDMLVSTRITGQIVLTVYDATGREVAAYSGNLAAGQHRFRFTAATPGVHVLTVLQGGERAAHRLVALAGEANGGGLAYAGNSGSGGVVKSDRSLFTWTPGDALRYIGYATDADIVQSAAIDEVPVTTATRTFVMTAGSQCPGSPTVTDIDGNVYPVVHIGSQCWMAANLKTTRYRDGTTIPNVTDNTEWTLLNTGAWSNCYNNPVNDATYGKLYNWYAAANPNLCPQGWHVPTDLEWQQLEMALGMTPVEAADNISARGAAQNVGGKLKATSNWNSPNSGATNESGFSGLPGGTRSYSQGSFFDLGNFGSWWTATENNGSAAWYRVLHYNIAGVGRFDYPKRQGACMRCVRD